MMSRIMGRTWSKWLLIVGAMLVAVIVGLLAYLMTPVPSVEVPTAEQPPFQKPVPHSLRGLPYAASEWPSVHGGPANNDYVATKSGVEFRREWQALEGMASLVAPTTGPEGNLYVSLGNPPGASNLYALDRRGNILWQTPPWQNRDDFDSCAAFNAPIVDTHGDLYVSDCDQLWAFRPDGVVKWVVELPAPEEGTAYQDIDEELEIFDPENPTARISVRRRTPMRSFVTAFFTADGSVGGVTVFGDVLIVSRDTGMPVAAPFRIPGAPPPPPEPPPFDKFMVGMLDGRMIQPLFDLVVGRTFKSSNTPAVNALDGRIFVAATGSELNTGALYGLDFVPSSVAGELGVVRLATQTLIGKESGSSPSISPDGANVYLGDETGKLYAIDARSGDVRCTTAEIGILAGSPSIGNDGTVLVLTGQGAAAIHAHDCKVKWNLDLDWLLDRELPASLELLLGDRSVSGGGTIAVTDTGLIMPVLLGYDLSIGGQTLPLAVKQFYVNIHPETGTLLSGSVPYEAEDSNDGWVVPLAGGQLVFNNGSMRSSLSALFAWLANPILSLHDLQLLTPKGGIESLRAVRFAESDSFSGV
jgi:outer membrane protein assembly factor BamB